MQQPVRALYEEDFVRWSDQQSRALRALQRQGTNLPLDWENLAEEIESLGRSQRQQLRNRLNTIIVHLLKLATSPAAEPRRKWKATVDRERVRISRSLLVDSPSLRGEVERMIAEETPIAAELAADSLDRYGELTDATRGVLASACFTPEQILGKWFPEEP